MSPTLLQIYTVQSRFWVDGTAFGRATWTVAASSCDDAIRRVRESTFREHAADEYRAVEGSNAWMLPDWAPTPEAEK